MSHHGGVPSRISVLAIDAINPKVVADFWCNVLGWRIEEESDEGISIAPEDGAWPTIDVLPVPEHKTVKNRLHLDLRADGVSTDVELERLLALGARRVEWGRRRMPAGLCWATRRATSSVCCPALSRTCDPRTCHQRVAAIARPLKHPAGGRIRAEPRPAGA